MMTITLRAGPAPLTLVSFGGFIRRRALVSSRAQHAFAPHFLQNCVEMKHVRWEYRFLASDDLPKDWLGDHKKEEALRFFNELGAEGWELVNVDWTDPTHAGFKAVFKRVREG